MSTATTPHINQVRQHLLGALASLCDRTNPMDVDRARAMATVAGVLVDTARVENEYLKLTNQDRSNFMEVPPDNVRGIDAPGGTTVPSAHNPFPVSKRHRLWD